MNAITATRERPALAASPYLKVVRASGAWDLIVTAGFATPWTFALAHSALNAVGGAFGLGSFPELDLMQVLYANLMGSVVVVWSLLRLVRPLPLYGFYDGIARVLFSTWMAYALASGAPKLVWVFLIPEMMWGVAQLGPWLVAAASGRSPVPGLAR